MEDTIMAEESQAENKRQRLSRIIGALQTRGERLTDEELQEMQLKTDALLAARAGDHDHDHALA
jgi:hypothetical protein